MAAKKNTTEALLSVISTLGEICRGGKMRSFRQTSRGEETTAGKVPHLDWSGHSNQISPNVEMTPVESYGNLIIIALMNG